MNKKLKKLLVQMHHFVLIYSLKYLSRWFKMIRDENCTKFIKNKLLKRISLIHKSYCSYSPASKASP
jgi:hypothetical protein